MDIRDRVHSASQDSSRLNSLAASRLNHNESKRINTHYRPAINNGVGYRLVLGCQQPDCYKGRGGAGPGYNSSGFGQCVVGSVHFYYLRADEVPLPAKDGKPRTVEVGVKIEKKRLSVY